MRILVQIYLLLQKEARLIWRSKLWFLVEIILGLLLLPLIIFISGKTNNQVSNSVIFEPVQITGNTSDIQQQVKNIPRIYTRWCGTSHTLGYSGPNSDGLMSKVQARYNGDPAIHLRHFDTVESMRAALTRDLNQTSEQLCGTYLGGILFENIDVENQQLKYRILFPRRMEQSWYLNDFWTHEGPYSAVADLNNIPGEPSYWSSGFLSVQFAVESAFLEMVNKPINFTVYLQRMPSPQYRTGGVPLFLKQVPLLWSMIVLMTIVHTLKNILTEKEAGIKVYMMVMGLNSIAFYGSHFVVGLIKMTLIIGICAGAFSFGLSYVSMTLFVGFSILYGMAAIVFGVLISTIIRRPSVAITVAIVGWIMLMVIDAQYTTSLTNILHCFLVSLNIHTAFKLGIKNAVMAESTASYLGWINMFSNSGHLFSFGFASLMLIFDIIVMVLVSLYLDAVWPTDNSPRRSPFFIFGYNSHTAATFAVGQDEVDSPNENMEPDSAMNRDQADIDVRKMSKIWETTGQMAVDSVSFRAYRGQVTVLLGQNGAGKSTTFSVISGSTAVTAGNVFICQEDIQSNLSGCQRQIGFCPQYNPLFARLTVKEHLRLYARLKTTKKSSTLNNEIDTIIGQVGLRPQANQLAENLSGGMKRKLCVAMALIGNSRVVLLDEPTAGMDPEARHDVRILLEKVKKNRTILLTTHYMDEADLLGDRIAIMVRGRMACSGSSEFLKNRFGTGYVLSIVVVTDASVCTSFDAIMTGVLKVTHKHAPSARFDTASFPEFSIILPVNQKAYFADLFEELENRKTELSISSFGLSFNTLEQVFLHVGEDVDSSDDKTEPESVCRNTASLFQDDKLEYTGLDLYAHQMLAMLRRHVLNVWRNKSRTITPVVASLLLFALFVGFGSSGKSFEPESEKLDLSLTKLESLSIPLVVSHDSAIKIDFPFIVSKIHGMKLISLSPLANLSAKLMDLAPRQSPPLGIGAQVMGNDTVLALFNGAAHHTPPAALLLVSNSMIKKKPDSIQMSIEIYRVEASSSESSSSPGADSNTIVAIIVILAFSSFTSTFVMPLVEEKESRFKHQLLLTKLNILTYWLSYTIWYLTVYIIFCFLLMIIFLIFGWMHGFFIPNMVVWALYIWCCLPFVYCASFIFKSAVKAYAGLICWNVLVSLIALIAYSILLAMDWHLEGTLNSVLFIILPSYSLGYGMVRIAIQLASDYQSEHKTAAVYDDLAQVLVCMFASGVIFWIILFLLESRKVSHFLHTLHCRIRKNPYEIINDVEANEDEDVLKERETMRTVGDENFALAVREVFKYYGRFCAVKNLTFGVRQRDCFGLLGCNGAGKTSTFNIITGEMYANSGRATVEGVDVVEGPSIGYCPQFDALAGELTGKELLTLLGELNGFQFVKERVLNVLESICMTNKADTLIKFYSGGQKRRLSIGVTLMARTGLIILDEPTAGIDPSTRRKIWQLLTAVRQHDVAILLTSHSMEECEALCNKIGFMNRGTLIGIGSSQHLKSRYSTSYMLTFTLTNPSEFSSRYLNSIVTQEFDAADTLDAPTTATKHFEIPRTNQSWSTMFRRAQQIANRHPHTAILPSGSELPLISDFSLTQNSLEQVFLRLAQSSQIP